jgi:hypothetical protein
MDSVIAKKNAMVEELVKMQKWKLNSKAKAMKEKYANQPMYKLEKRIEKKRELKILGPFREAAGDSGADKDAVQSEALSDRDPTELIPIPNLLSTQLGGEAGGLTHTTVARAKEDKDRVKELAATVSAISRLVKVLRDLQSRVDTAPAAL